MSRFQATTARFEGAFVLEGPVEDIFLLFSPEGETHWVPGWSPEMVNPADWVWQEGQIFRTAGENGEAIWVVAKLDRKEHRVTYYRTEPGHYVAQIEVRCTATADSQVDVETQYAYTGLDEAGNAKIAAMTQAEYDVKMLQWQGWTRSCLSHPGSLRRMSASAEAE